MTGSGSLSAPARSVFVFGIYLHVLGLVLVLVPNLLLGAFGFPPTEEVWIRVVGVLALCIGFYYVRAAKREMREFFGWTALVRTFVFLAFAAFAAVRLAPPPLALFGAVDFAGALWTWWALRGSAEPAS